MSINKVYYPIILEDELERFMLTNGTRFCDGEMTYFTGKCNEQIVLHSKHIDSSVGNTVMLDDTQGHREAVKSLEASIQEGMEPSIYSKFNFSHLSVSDYVVMAIAMDDGITLSAADGYVLGVDSVTVPYSEMGMEIVHSLERLFKG